MSSYNYGVYGDGTYSGAAASGELVPEESGVIYTDQNAIPQWAKESYGIAPAYPAQTRTYVATSRNWDMSLDPTGSGLAATQFSWTRTELHN